MKSFFLSLFLFINFFSNAQDLDNLLDKVSKAKEDTNKVNLYDAISKTYYYTDKQLNKKYTDSILYLSDKINYDDGKYRAHFNYAEYYYWKRDWAKMEYHAGKGQEIHKKMTGKVDLDISYLYGNYYREIGDVDRALKIYHELMDEYRKLNNKEYEAKILGSTALLFIQKERYQEAEEYFLKSAQIQKELSNPNAEAIVYQNLGGVYGEQGNFEKALHYTIKSLEIQTKLGNSLMIAGCETNLAAFYNAVKDYQKGLEYINKAALVYREQGDTYYMMRINIQRAESYIGLKNYDVAIKELNEATKIVEDDPTLENELIDVYYQYWKVYEAIGDYKNAFHFHKLYKDLHQEIMNLDVQNNISQLKEQFEAHQRDEKIKLLEEQNNTKDAYLKANAYFISSLVLLLILLIVGGYFIRKQSRLKQQKQAVELEHRALRTQMNPHFIFNALNSIQRMYVEGDTDKANDFMADFAQLMRKVLENSGSTKITLQEEVDTLRLYLDLEQLRSKNSFSYTITVNETIPTHEVKIPPLIVQPFVENAIWHGVLPMKTRHGEISIFITQEQDKLRVSITDNGAGFDETASLSKHLSKGIQITEQRIGEKVAVKSEKEKGTTVEFLVKIG